MTCTASMLAVEVTSRFMEHARKQQMRRISYDVHYQQSKESDVGSLVHAQPSKLQISLIEQ